MPNKKPNNVFGPTKKEIENNRAEYLKQFAHTPRPVRKTRRNRRNNRKSRRNNRR